MADTDAWQRDHARELAQGHSAIYGVFDFIGTAGFPDSVKGDISREAARLADVILWQQLVVERSRVEENLARLRDLPPDLQPRAARAWRATAEAAANSRRVLFRVLYEFFGWLDGVPHPSLPAVLALLPAIGRVLRDLKPAELAALIRDAAASTLPAENDAVCRAVAAYGETTAPIVLAVAHIARAGAAHGRPAQVATLVGAVPISAMEESEDSERLLPAVAALSAVAERFGDACWADAFDLMLELVPRQHSSGRVAARKLARSLPTMEAGAAAAYLADVLCVIRSTGVRSLSFCLDALPRLYARHGADATRRFVQTAVAVAENYGTVAGELFLEQKTAASRRCLGSPPSAGA